MQTIAIHAVPAMPASMTQDIASDDPLAVLERAVGRTPTGQAIAPGDLARFHDPARRLFDDVQEDDPTLLAKTPWRPPTATLVLLEMLLSMRQFDRAAQLGAHEAGLQMLHDRCTIPAAQFSRQRVHLAQHPEVPAFVQRLEALPQEGKPRVLSDFPHLL